MAYVHQTFMLILQITVFTLKWRTTALWQEGREAHTPRARALHKQRCAAMNQALIYCLWCVFVVRRRLGSQIKDLIQQEFTRAASGKMLPLQGWRCTNTHSDVWNTNLYTTDCILCDNMISSTCPSIFWAYLGSGHGRRDPDLPLPRPPPPSHLGWCQTILNQINPSIASP